MQEKKINPFIVFLNKMSLWIFCGLNRGNQGQGDFQDHFLGLGMVYDLHSRFTRNLV